MPRCGRPASRAISRRARADETNPALSVDRKLRGASTVGPHTAQPAPAAAPHDLPRSADACRSAIGRPILLSSGRSGRWCESSRPDSPSVIIPPLLRRHPGSHSECDLVQEGKVTSPSAAHAEAIWPPRAAEAPTRCRTSSSHRRLRAPPTQRGQQAHPTHAEQGHGARLGHDVDIARGLGERQRLPSRHESERATTEA